MNLTIENNNVILEFNNIQEVTDISVTLLNLIGRHIKTGLTSAPAMPIIVNGNTPSKIIMCIVDSNPSTCGFNRLEDN